MIKAIALDPGRTTGYAHGRIDDAGVMLVVTGQEKMKHIDLWKHLNMVTPQFIVCERFVFRHGIYKHHGADMYPRELIGVVEMYKQMYNNCEVILQNAMKDGPRTYFNNKRLKGDGIYKSGRDHANDAARHLLYWFTFGSGYQFNKGGHRQGVLT